MKNLLKKINYRPFLLAGIAILICALNYTPGTWLSGWDTLHPEFDFSLNFQRILNGVWREEQGLGAVAGHAHISELPRLVFLWISSLVLPIDFLRYFFFFACLVLGPLGVYFYLKKNNFKETSSFLGGLFYLLNLGTVQHFFVPFEMFGVLYASLPFLLLLAGKFLEEGKKKQLLWFAAATVLSASMAYASVLWFAYFAFLTLFVSANVLAAKGKSWKRGLILLASTLVLNLYWLLPNLYFLGTSAKNVTEAKTNLMFSERAFLTDEKYANFTDAALLKGFLFDWQKYDGEKFTFLLKDWKEYLANPAVSAIGFVIFSFVLLGILSVIVKREKRGLVLLPGFVFAFIFLVHGASGIKEVFDFLRSHIDVFKESLRFPWTKFSIFVIFGYSIFFASGLERIFIIFKQKKFFTITLSIIVCALLTVWTLPVFKGKLISPMMRIKIPGEYFEMFKWFEKQPENERIALLPLSTYWGWEYYKFGYEGAGFVWFGLKQPVLVRDFDRWQPENENFYWELSYAVDSKNGQAFQNVFEKYQVSWIMLDGNIVNPAWPMAEKQGELEEMIEDTEEQGIENKEQSRGKYELAATFGKIKIYKVNLETEVKDFVYLAKDLPVINSYNWGNLDVGFGEFGGYVCTGERDPSTSVGMTTYYPFRSLFTGRKIDELKVQIEDLGDKIVFKAELPEEVVNYAIELPENYDGKELPEINPETLEVRDSIPVVDVIKGELWDVGCGSGMSCGGEEITVTFPKIKGLLSAEINPVEKEIEAKNCNQFGNGSVINKDGLWVVGRVVGTEGEEEKVLRTEASDANNCGANFWLPNLSHKYSYLISAETKNISGKPLLFWLENLTNRKADQEVYLNSEGISLRQLADRNDMVQPPMAGDGMGYSLHFDNISIGKEKTVNELGKINVNLIPYKFLTEIKMVKQGEGGLWDVGRPPAGGVGVGSEEVTVNHPNPAFYEIKFDAKGDMTLVLSQAYNEGWKAYEMTNDQFSIFNKFPIIFGKKLEQVKVNNWENGWKIPATTQPLSPNTYVIIFWPQWLEWGGFGLFGLYVLWLLGYSLGSQFGYRSWFYVKKPKTNDQKLN